MSAIFRYALVPSLAVVLLLGCGASPNPSLDAYRATLTQGTKFVDHVSEITAMFSNCPGDHFITYFGFSEKPVTWNTVTYFGGRYELTYQVDVKVNYTENRIERITNTPKFHLQEIDTIESLPDGRFQVAYRRKYGEFSTNDWSKVVAASGNFSAIGWNLTTNQPLDNFDAYVRASTSGTLKPRK